MWKFGVRKVFVSGGMLGMLQLQLRTYEATVSSGGMTEAWWWKIHQLCQLEWEFRCFSVEKNLFKKEFYCWMAWWLLTLPWYQFISRIKPNQTFEVTVWNCLQSCHNTELIKIQPTCQGCHIRLRIYYFLFYFCEALILMLHEEMSRV